MREGTTPSVSLLIFFCIRFIVLWYLLALQVMMKLFSLKRNYSLKQLGKELRN